MLIRILYFEQAAIIAAVVCSLIVAGLRIPTKADSCSD